MVFKRKNKAGLTALVALVALASLWCALAQAGTSDPIEITLAQEAQEVLQQVAPVQKKSLEKDIRVGHAFVQRYIDGRAYDLDPEIYDIWSKDTGPLMAMDAKTFAQMIGGVGGDNWISFDIKDNKYPSWTTGYRLACPAASLVKIDTASGKTMLTYRIQKIGYIIHYNRSSMREFVAARDGGSHEVRLTLEPNHRISAVLPSEQGVPSDYRLTILGMEGFIRKPPFDTKEAIEAAVAMRRQIIKDIGRAAAEICPNPPTNNTSPKEK